MKRELGIWLMDIAKYIITAVVLTSIFGTMDGKWAVWLGILAVVVTLFVGLWLVKENK